MEHCVQSAVRRMREFWPAGERVVIVFDRQDVYRGRAALRFEHYLKGRRYGPHIAGMGYVNSADADLSGPLGAADLVAFETAKHLHNRRYDHDRAPRVVFDRLWRESSVDAKYWDREAFEGLIEMIAHVKPSDDPLP